MKIRKTADQKNFKVDIEYYTESDLNRMEANGIISDLNKQFNKDSDSPHYVIFTSNCTDVNVKCIDGYYQVLATTKDNDDIHISL